MSLLRSFRLNSNFGFLTEVEECQKFDDLIFWEISREKAFWFFLQIKHDTNAQISKLSSEQLFKKPHAKNSFSLITYFKAYCELLRKKKKLQLVTPHCDFANFILLTNKGLDFAKLQKEGVYLQKAKLTANLPTSPEGCFKFVLRPKNPHYKLLSETAMEIREDNENPKFLVESFLSKFVLAVGQLDLKDLEEKIAEEFEMVCGPFKVYSFQQSIKQAVWKWFLSPEVAAITLKSFREFFAASMMKILSDVHIHDIITYGIRVGEDRCELSILECENVSNIVCPHGTLLAASAILQVVDNLECCLFINGKELENPEVQSMVSHALSIFDLLIIDCKDFNAERSIFNSLRSFFGNNNKKMVILSKNAIFPECETEWDICFVNLEPKTQELLYGRKVLWLGYECVLGILCQEGIVHPDTIDGRTTMKLINNEIPTVRL